MKKHYIILISIITIFFFTDCGKNREEKIIGKWEMAWMVANENPTYKIVWDITEDSKIIETTTKIDDGTTVVKNGTYKFERQAGVEYIRIYDLFDIKTFNGKYRILRLTKEVLSIEEREDNEGEYEFNHIEFIKID